MILNPSLTYGTEDSTAASVPLSDLTYEVLRVQLGFDKNVTLLEGGTPSKSIYDGDPADYDIHEQGLIQLNMEPSLLVVSSTQISLQYNSQLRIYLVGYDLDMDTLSANVTKTDVQSDGFEAYLQCED